MSCQYWPEISTCFNEVEREKFALTKKAISLDTMTEARENITRHVDQLRISLEQVLDKQSASQILFAIVAYFDEEIQRFLVEKGQGNWVPLQKDLYGAYNAGNLYYETIDKIIEDPLVPEIVYRVFYFILKKGFLGKYRDAKTHVKKYIEILKGKISVTTPTHLQKELKSNPLQMKKKIKPWHFYFLTSFATCVLVVLLYMTSSM